MTTKATLTRLHEEATGYDRIDRSEGVIYGVKILSGKSRNGRRYLQEAMEDSTPRYEGVKVFIDHVDPKASKRRATRERWGVLKNVRYQEGLVGDLHYLKTHGLTEQILESIERFADAGLSHDAGGKTRKQDGEEVVYEIAEVYSVDFVQNPATNKNLFEAETMKRKPLLATLREHVKLPLASTLLARLVEMDGEMEGMYGESAMMDAPEESTPEDDVDAAFKAAIMSILDMDADTKERIAKIKMLLDVQDKLAGGGSTTTTSTTESDPTMTEEVTKLRQELAELKEQRTIERETGVCKALLESMDIEPTDVRVKALIPLEADGRKLLAEQFAKRVQKPARSPGRLNLQESAEAKVPDTVEGIKSLLGVGK